MHNLEDMMAEYKNEKLKRFYDSICGKKIAVVGLGVTNTPLAKMLAAHGAQVTVCDRKSREELSDVYEELSMLGITFSLGGGYLDHLEYDIIFKTPGMRCDMPQLKAAADKGAIITSEMELFFEICPAPIYAVTGSDGKTTTATLIYEMFKAQGFTCYLGGNIGIALTPIIEEIRPEHKVVLELSSFQLHMMTHSSDTAIITNISTNHLDWHKSMEEYVEAKENIFSHQEKDGRLILNFDNPYSERFAKKAVGEVLYFSKNSKVKKGAYLKDGKILFSDGNTETEILDASDIVIPGLHNVENYMTAITAVRGEVSADNIRKVATTFSGVEHRIEFVRELFGVKYYNDSKATTPTSSRAGLYAFDKKVILIMGGYDKKIPFDELGDVISERVKTLVLLGVTAPKIESAVKESKLYDKTKIEILNCKTLDEAVDTCREKAASGDVVILSPACASFDMFKNFEERGEEFKKLVNALK